MGSRGGNEEEPPADGPPPDFQMRRVAAMIEWQTRVAEAVRICPQDYAANWKLGEWDERFEGHYDFEGYPDDGYFNDDGDREPCSEALKFILQLAYIKTRELNRRQRDCGYASRVFVEGWDHFTFASAAPREEHWNVLTEMFDPPDWETSVIDGVVNKQKAWALCEDFSRCDESLAPVIGNRACYAKPKFCRGARVDLPGVWERLFDTDDVSSFPPEDAVHYALVYEYYQRYGDGLPRETQHQLMGALLQVRMDYGPLFQLTLYFNLINFGPRIKISPSSRSGGRILE